MLYLFVGDNKFLIDKELKAWKNRFISKFGDFNLSHIKEIEKFDNNFISSTLLSIPFMGEKKLVIIDSIPTPTKPSEELQEKVDYILSIIQKIPAEVIVVFTSYKPDKRSKSYKELLKKSELKEFNTPKPFQLKNILTTKYLGKINSGAIDLLMRYKANNLGKIVQEIDKLLIGTDEITEELIKKSILPELEESIFDLIKDIMYLNKVSVISKLNIILEQDNIYRFYNLLISLLRANIYIFKMKQLELPSSEIANILNLGKRAFLVDTRYKISYEQLADFYTNLINLDKRMKTGTLTGIEEKDFKFAIERLVLSI